VDPRFAIDELFEELRGRDGPSPLSPHILTKERREDNRRKKGGKETKNRKERNTKKRGRM